MLFKTNEIERYKQVVNDEDCIEYEMFIPIEDVNIIEVDEYWKIVSEEDEKKYFDQIKERIDFSKEKLYDDYSEVKEYDKVVRFTICTRDKEVIRKEKKIREKLNINEYCRINFRDDGWIEIGDYPKTSKNGMKELEEKLNLKDWKIYPGLYGCLEDIYIAILPNGEV